MRRKPRTVLCLVLVSAMVAGFGAHWYVTQPVPLGVDGTEVRHLASCGAEVSPGTPWRVEDTSPRGGDLIVRAAVVASCGPLTASKPASKVQGEGIFLTWEWHVPSGAAVAACTCRYRLEFRVPGAAGLQSPAVELDVRDSARAPSSMPLARTAHADRVAVDSP